jgi:predicted dehydrogenase
MTSARIRWGILATGAIATKFVRDLRLLPDAEVLAVGSRSAPAAADFARRHDIPRAYGSWADLAADADLDVVYVATPHSAHDAAARVCLAAGRAVLCEKPLTLDRPSSQALIEYAKANGRFLMEGMWTRCDPLVRRLLALVADGAIGEVTAVHADFGVAGPFPATHRMRARSLGGGALLDLGVYPVTMAHLLLGVPDEIRAWARLDGGGADENTGMIFGYASGALASLTCGMVGDTGVRATVTGTRGRIELPPGFYRPTSLTLHRSGASPEVIREPVVGGGYQHEAAEVQRCLRAGELDSPLVPHAATLEVMSILDAVRAQVGVVYPADGGDAAAAALPPTSSKLGDGEPPAAPTSSKLRDREPAAPTSSKLGDGAPSDTPTSTKLREVG